MGNKIGRRRQVIDEKYTRPQGLYQLRDIDHKKLRKLILDSKLAPCYPGDDEGCTLDLEECPICFLYFPSLNRSKCCTKGICTECFLQMKPSHSARPSQCPFCKTSNYAVEYRGAKTKEEKGVEQVEEQRVIEAQIRMRHQELRDEKRKFCKKEDSSSLSRSHSERCCRYSIQDDDVVSSQGSCSGAASARPSYSMQNREENFDLDLENIMIMRAIWQSIQEQGMQSSSLFYEDCFSCNPTFPAEPSSLSCTMLPPSPLSDSTHISRGGVNSMAGNLTPSSSNLLRSSSAHFPTENWRTDLGESTTLTDASIGWMIIDGHGPNPIEAAMTYSSPNIVIDPGMDSGHVVVPENFDDRMMLTMAVSAAEGGGRMNSQEGMWLL